MHRIVNSGFSLSGDFLTVLVVIGGSFSFISSGVGTMLLLRRLSLPVELALDAREIFDAITTLMFQKLPSNLP